MSCVFTDPVCNVFGEPHYKTFDCQKIEYQGTGTYLLTSNTDPTKEVFKVSHKIAEKPGLPGVTWLHRIYLVYNGMRIRVGDGDILKVSETPTQHSWLHLVDFASKTIRLFYFLK